MSSYLLINTVSEQKQHFTRHEIDGADQARDLFCKIGRPGYFHFTQLLHTKAIQNCPVTNEDLKKALFIYEPDVAALKGRTTRQAPTHVEAQPPIPIPDPIRWFHQKVTLCVYFFYVQGMAFLYTISQKIQFLTIKDLINWTKKQILNGINQVIKIYMTRELKITNIHADNEFESLMKHSFPYTFISQLPMSMLGKWSGQYTP